MSKTPKEIWCRSGLYYEYVKDWSEGSWSPTNDGGVKYVRADRIEELEAKLAKAVEALRYALDGAAYSYNGMNFEGEYSDELATLNELTGESHD